MGDNLDTEIFDFSKGVLKEQKHQPEDIMN